MKKILIIGAGQGIGGAIGQKLARNAELWTTTRNTEPEFESTHRAWDSSQEFPADFLPDDLDGLVYCPGTIRLKPFERLTLDDYEQDLEVNLKGAVRVLKAAIPALRAAPHASVVLFSTVAVTTGMPMHASIASAKGAIEGLTRSLAAEYAPGVRFNAIAPSLTDTSLASGLLRTERQREAAAARHPLERIGDPDELAALAGFLLSDDSRWITGQVLHADGGMSSIRKFA
ncbi:MAG: SDR family oxidoreductase [Chromatiales bacterium]|jgi:NAD(P)-dependent dehydrogenase (short-subunit alcohol dehydrogenase family)